MAVDILFLSKKYGEFIRDENVRKRRSFVVGRLDNNGALPRGARAQLKHDLQANGFSVNDTALDHDLGFWRHTLSYPSSRGKKREEFEKRANTKPYRIKDLGIRVLLAEAVRTWGDLKKK